ncbi:hypothetical protein C0W96_14250 [Photobacterium kishitanii]|nr:hypothetical protein CTM84_07815 [Photobacterium kishitanii]PSV05191.1 hypothetical protein C0W96_14250 [Photobacterium kishitanii]PSV76011.1 hypothetical protein C0W29_09270 [Photobacterium kishitanii]
MHQGLSKNTTLDVRCEMRDARCEMRDARCEMRENNQLKLMSTSIGKKAKKSPTRGLSFSVHSNQIKSGSEKLTLRELWTTTCFT